MFSLYNAWWANQEHTITPWTLPPRDAFPHILTNSNNSVWLARTKDFIEVAALRDSEIDVDGLLDSESSVTVLVQGPIGHPGPPFFCVTVTMDHAFDVLACFMFGPSPFESLFDSTRLITPIYNAHGFRAFQPSFTSMGAVPARRRRNCLWQDRPVEFPIGCEIPMMVCTSNRTMTDRGAPGCFRCETHHRSKARSDAKFP